jgi:oligopeptide transport system permease protein
MPVPRRRSSGSLWADAFYRLVRNRASVLGGTIIIILVLLAIFAPAIYPRGYDLQVLTHNHAVPQWLLSVFPFMRPGKMVTPDGTIQPIPGATGYVTIDNEYPIGADTHGRDLLTRIIYGAQVSLAVAFIGPLISLLVGTTYGTISGYVGGRTDNFMMRIVDYCTPSPACCLSSC